MLTIKIYFIYKTNLLLYYSGPNNCDLFLGKFFRWGFDRVKVLQRRYFASLSFFCFVILPPLFFCKKSEEKKWETLIFATNAQNKIKDSVYQFFPLASKSLIMSWMSHPVTELILIKMLHFWSYGWTFPKLLPRCFPVI